MGITRKFLENIQHIIVTASPTMMELFSAITALGWGVLLLLPYDTFGSSSIYVTMSALAPEELWGIALLGGGFLQLAAVLHGKISPRKLTAMFATASWAFIAAMFASSSIYSTGVVVYGVMTLFAAWIYFRLDVFNNL